MLNVITITMPIKCNNNNKINKEEEEAITVATKQKTLFTLMRRRVNRNRQLWQ
jgi:hypothetical protein